MLDIGMKGLTRHLRWSSIVAARFRGASTPSSRAASRPEAATTVFLHAYMIVCVYTQKSKPIYI